MFGEGRLSLRLVEIPLEAGVAIGLLLSYVSPRNARDVGDALVRYITAPSGDRSMTVEFVRENPDTYRMLLALRNGADSLRIVVERVERRDVERLRESLETFSNYMILVGYETGGEPEVLGPNDGRLVKSDVLIDGERVVGNPGDGVDWIALLSGDDVE